MEFLNRCNGSHSKAIPATITMTVMFECHINQARHEFRELNLDPERYYTSVRFNDDRVVLDRIRSAVTDEAEFQADPKAWIMDALRDCAGADHWYTFEKEW